MLGIGGAVGGAYVANSTYSQSIIDIDDAETQVIPRKKTVQGQYEAAIWAPLTQKEKYWLAVIDYFPIDQASEENEVTTRLHIRWAKARLAELYLLQDRYDEAMPIFEEFTGYKDVEEQLQVTGWAGIAIVLDAIRAEEASTTDFQRQMDLNEAIRKVLGREDKLNVFMKDRFDRIVERKNVVELPPILVE